MDRALEARFRDLAEQLDLEVYRLEVDKIRPSMSIRLKCQIPICEYFDNCKVCPPNIPTVDEFREALKDYSRAFLVVYKERIDRIETYRNDFSAELKLQDGVAALESTAQQLGFYRALGLCVGGCKLCETCTPKGEPCRHPFKARPSPEGFGIDITELARAVGVEVEWPPKKHVNFMGLLLV